MVVAFIIRQADKPANVTCHVPLRFISTLKKSVCATARAAAASACLMSLQIAVSIDALSPLSPQASRRSRFRLRDFAKPMLCACAKYNFAQGKRTALEYYFAKLKPRRRADDDRRASDTTVAEHRHAIKKPPWKLYTFYGDVRVVSNPDVKPIQGADVDPDGYAKAARNLKSSNTLVYLNIHVNTPEGIPFTDTCPAECRNGQFLTYMQNIDQSLDLTPWWRSKKAFDFFHMKTGDKFNEQPTTLPSIPTRNAAGRNAPNAN
uniref:Uncharacterized protein n=1 Tax=Oryza nivara TaxID=4536 RepID=A0A0E0HKW8_ORYNI